MIYTSEQFAKKFLTQDQINKSNENVKKILNGEKLDEELTETQENSKLSVNTNELNN